MVLVDTSVWIEHFHSSVPLLVDLLNSGKVVTHEFILGELSLAHFKKSDRKKIFERLQALEKIPSSKHEEVFVFAERHKLAGKGIGWIDSHLLHAAYANKLQLLSFDKSLTLALNRLRK